VVATPAEIGINHTLRVYNQIDQLVRSMEFDQAYVLCRIPSELLPRQIAGAYRRAGWRVALRTVDKGASQDLYLFNPRKPGARVPKGAGRR